MLDCVPLLSLERSCRIMMQDKGLLLLLFFILLFVFFGCGHINWQILLPGCRHRPGIMGPGSLFSLLFALYKRCWPWAAALPPTVCVCVYSFCNELDSGRWVRYVAGSCYLGNEDFFFPFLFIVVSMYSTFPYTLHWTRRDGPEPSHNGHRDNRGWLDEDRELQWPIKQTPCIKEYMCI